MFYGPTLLYKLSSSFAFILLKMIMRSCEWIWNCEFSHHKFEL